MAKSASSEPVTILCAAGPSVNAATRLAVRRLEQLLSEAGCPRPLFAAIDVDAAAPSEKLGSEALVILDLAEEVGTLDDGWVEVEARVRSRIKDWRAVADRLFLCTVLRHVSADAGGEADRRRLRARIRRLNLLAVALSAETGLFVVDLDRALGGAGAGGYDTDYRLGGGLALDGAAHEITATLLSAGLDLLAPTAYRRVIRQGLEGWTPVVLAQQAPSPASLARQVGPSSGWGLDAGAGGGGRRAFVHLRRALGGHLSPREMLGLARTAAARLARAAKAPSGRAAP